MHVKENTDERGTQTFLRHLWINDRGLKPNNKRHKIKIYRIKKGLGTKTSRFPCIFLFD